MDPQTVRLWSCVYLQFSSELISRVVISLTWSRSSRGGVEVCQTNWTAAKTESNLCNNVQNRFICLRFGFLHRHVTEPPSLIAQFRVRLRMGVSKQRNYTENIKYYNSVCRNPVYSTVSNLYIYYIILYRIKINLHQIIIQNFSVYIVALR